MQFRTQVPIRPYDHLIDYTSRIVSLGSCFAVNIAEKLDYLGFRNLLNPFGILFHPPAIQRIIELSLLGKEFTAADIFFHNERWHSFDAHSDLSSANKEQLLESLNRQSTITREELSKASHLLLTFGTAWVYEDIASDKIVANCHKIPQKNFKKLLLPVDVIRDSIAAISTAVKAINPDITIITTISPVRHIKDGFIENQRSKSHLITALHQAADSNLVTYFPSYEIMMDELRDYRFYANDMLHPNTTAIEYIWKQFSTAIISSAAASTMDEVLAIRKGLAHRPFDTESESHQAFTSKLQHRISALQAQYPHLKF